MVDFVSPTVTMTVATELTGDYCSADSVEHERTSPLESQRKESAVSQWTDEKHSLYLKSMEASFVSQLYSSSELLSWQSQKECSSDSISSRKRHATTCTPSGQFKVLQDGCWSKISFGREQSLQNKADRSHAIPANPWIQHFRTGCTQETMASPLLQGKLASSASQQSPAARSDLCCEDSGSNTEVSDQNFVEELVRIEKASRLCKRKRMRSSVVASSSNDQVVPL